ncbi:MAG: phosphoglycerate kinase [Candidatus Hadarchaeota archaeon]|nr:phosphoglycerate kinase [Candidatus Hadarchaeota archaeon]
MAFKTLDDVEVKGKAVLVRVDINSPIDPESKEILDDTRIRECSKTLIELMSKGAKVVVLAHQGRPGREDFTTLEKHAQKLSNTLGRQVKYVDDIFGTKALEAIKSLDPDEVLLLENVRSYPDENKNRPPEEQAKTELVRKLSEVADLYVNDAFAAAHRSQPSLVGFGITLPAVAGRLLERELKGLQQALKPEHPCVYVLGGAKVEDSLTLAEHVLNREMADKVLTGGLVGQAFIAASGCELGEPNLKVLAEKEYQEEIKRGERLLSTHGDKIKIPSDVTVEEDRKIRELSLDQLPTELPIYDIGSKTLEEYSKLIGEAKTVVANGPVGVIERPEFARGTMGILRAMAGSGAFTIIGGGHMVAAAKEAKVIDQLSHVSTGGGACLSFLSGEKLPVVEVLERSAEQQE